MTNKDRLNELYPHTLRCMVQDCPECAEYLKLAEEVGREMGEPKLRGADHPLVKVEKQDD